MLYLCNGLHLARWMTGCSNNDAASKPWLGFFWHPHARKDKPFHLSITLLVLFCIFKKIFLVIRNICWGRLAYYEYMLTIRADKMELYWNLLCLWFVFCISILSLYLYAYPGCSKTHLISPHLSLLSSILLFCLSASLLSPILLTLLFPSISPRFFSISPCTSSFLFLFSLQHPPS